MPPHPPTNIWIHLYCSLLVTWARSTRGNNSRGHHFFVRTVLVCTRFGKSIFQPYFTARERKPRENRHFHGNRSDRNENWGFPTVTIWVGTENQDFCRDCLGGGPRERYLHQNDNNSQLSWNMEGFSCGNVPVDCPCSFEPSLQMCIWCDTWCLVCQCGGSNICCDWCITV